MLLVKSICQKMVLPIRNFDILMPIKIYDFDRDGNKIQHNYQ